MEAVREPVFAKNEQGISVFTGMSAVKRTVTGTGVFLGQNAYQVFKSLQGVYREGTAGDLIHPVWGTYQMYFTKLVMNQDPKENFVAYRFEFREADADGAVVQ